MHIRCVAIIQLSLFMLARADSKPADAGKPNPPTCSTCVTLSWDASGDFGPQTPNTKTAGWQEAVDYCVANARDLYVAGGWGGRKPVYNVSETIRIPATQDFRIDGGVYVLNWTGAADAPDKDLMVIDSAMNAEYHFGIFVYGGAGAALRIRPEKPVPIDGFPVVVETAITSQGMADPHPFEPGERKAGTGLVLDGTKAPIVSSRFDFIGGILNFKTCIEALGTVSQNHFGCQHLHTNATNSTLFSIGPKCGVNTIDLVIGVDMGATGVRGIDVSGVNNELRITTRGGFSKANDIILEPSASGNRIDVIQGNDVFDPQNVITDNATKPTNRVFGVGGTIPIRKIDATTGSYSYSQRLYAATVRILGGAVSKVSLERGDASVDYTVVRESGAPMSPGDVLRVESTAAPHLEIIPIAIP